MRCIATGAITLASSLLARGIITLNSLSSRFSNAVAVAKKVWLVVVFDPETAVLIRQSSGTADDAPPDDAISKSNSSTRTWHLLTKQDPNRRPSRVPPSSRV